MEPEVRRPPQEEAQSPGTKTARPAGRPQLAALAQMPQVRIGAVVALAIAAGLVVWLLARGNDHSKTKRAPAAAASVQGLLSLAASVRHPVYWAGPKQGFKYELTRTAEGRIYIRYLPPGVPIGDSRPDYLSIGTYPVKNALGAVRAIAKREKTATLTLTGGGIAVQDANHPTSVYFAYPGSDYQVEVFDPSPATARRLVLSGQVSAIGGGSGPTQSARARPKKATIKDLRALSSAVGHPVYWAGEEPGMTYERTQTSDGRIYVRYLPPGVKVGDRRPHAAVGTYPVQNALAAIKAIAKRPGARTFPVAGGGLAVVDPTHPTSVYLAFPGSNYQIEVFDPSPARARRLVTAGRIVPVR